MGAIGERYLTKREFETYVRQINKSLSSLRITQPGTTAGSGVTHFTGLSDVPGSYSGQAGKVVVVNAGENALAFTNTPTFSGVTIGALAGLLKGTAGIVSAVANTTSADYMGGDAAYHTLNQAAVAGLKTTDSPVFVTVALSGLNAGYIPYQVGGILDDSVLFCQGNNLGMGMASFGAGADYVFALMNGTAPAAHGDCFQLYSADFGGGVGLACPHIMIENGTIVRLNQDISTLAAPTFSGLTLSSQSSARAYRTTSGQTITSGSWQKIQLNAENWDNNNEFDIAVNYDFTCTVAGIYLVVGSIFWLDLADQDFVQQGIYVNEGLRGSIQFAASGTGYNTLPISDIVKVNANDVISLRVYQNTGVDRTVWHGQSYTFMAVYRLA